MRRICLLSSLSLAFLLVACGGKDGDSGGTSFVPVDSGDPEPDCDLSTDADCDGVLDADDCDPNDPTTYPGAPEIPYDGADNDCAGDGDLTDVDGDGYDSDRVGGDDCNDGNPEAYPGAPEACNGVDDDCDGFPTTPEEEADDCDNDGWGPGAGGDCDDEDPNVNPDAEDVWYDGVDADCDGQNDYDADGDGDEHRDHGDGGDCDDDDPTVFTDAKEVLDGRDNDCDDDVDTVGLFDAHATFYGTTSSGDGWTGMDAAGMDDYDGDGLNDWVVGGPLADVDREACLETGSCQGWVQIIPSSAPSTDPPGTIAHGRIEGNGSWMGFKVDNIGDLTGDGMAELAVGAPFSGGAGAVFVYDGQDLATGGTMGESDKLAKLTGGALIGLDVGDVADVNGDGLAEVFGSSGFNDQAVGEMTVWVGVWSGADVASGGNLTGGSAQVIVEGSTVGGEVVGSHDLDGDGLGDLVVASRVTGTGELKWVSGTDIWGGSHYDGSDFSGPAGDAGDKLGTHLAVLDDVDQDGYPEVAAGGPGATGAAVAAEGGVVYLLNGNTLATSTSASADAMFTIQGSLDYGALGVTGSRGGDIDGDGTEDLVTAYMGGSAVGIVRGSAHIFYGHQMSGGGTAVAEDGGSSLTTRFDGDRFGLNGDLFDIEGDGDADIITGAFEASSSCGLTVVYRSEW